MLLGQRLPNAIRDSVSCWCDVAVYAGPHLESRACFQQDNVAQYVAGVTEGSLRAMTLLSLRGRYNTRFCALSHFELMYCIWSSRLLVQDRAFPLSPTN